MDDLDEEDSIDMKTDEVDRLTVFPVSKIEYKVSLAMCLCSGEHVHVRENVCEDVCRI